ncbi:hypothetical protein ACLMJK_000164 [Lecanora helva]
MSSRPSGPTLINLPPPPRDPGGTPSDFGPGTPNSGFSTTAIKDGHQGQAHPHHAGHAHSSSTASDSSTNTLDAERADRISRLAGLERVATLRGASQHLSQPPTQGALQQPQQQQPPGYFDNASVAGLHKSTVGSASATGSAGGRNTWASASDPGDRMSEDQDDVGDSVSSAGMSEEGNASLVGFGEGAGSTVSGPTSSKGTLGRDRDGVMSPATSMRLQKSDSNPTNPKEWSPMEGVKN